MLDTATLRVAFGLVALAVLVLFYAATYRSTRSVFSAWWCVSLALFVVGASLFLLNGTVLQVVANPLGNALSTAGSAAVWAGATSLRGRTLPGWKLASGPGVVLVASLLDDPVDDVWTGGPVFLVAMGALLGVASRQLYLLGRDIDGIPRTELGPVARADDLQYRASVTAMTLMSGVLATFYLLRAAVFVAVGPDHWLFETAFGSQTTTLLTLVLLVVVTYTMAILTHQQQTSELRTRATRDGLTGLLNRRELVRRIESALQDPDDAAAAAVLIADLDGFKQLNDRLGHAAGDHALAVFGAVAESALRPGDCVGRLGGDEFALLVRDGGRAEDVATQVAQGLRRKLGPEAALTVSIGIASGSPGVTVDAVLHHADVALYRAKAAGRDRAVRYDGPDGPLPPEDRRTVRQA